VLHALIEFFPSDSIVEPLTLLNIALVITQAIAQQHSAALDVLTRVGLPVWVTRFLALFVVILWDNLHTACSPCLWVSRLWIPAAFPVYDAPYPGIKGGIRCSDAFAVLFDTLRDTMLILAGIFGRLVLPLVARWVTLINGVIAYIRIQIHARLTARGVSGQKPARRRVIVTVR